MHNCFDGFVVNLYLDDDEAWLGVAQNTPIKKDPHAQHLFDLPKRAE